MTTPRIPTYLTTERVLQKALEFFKDAKKWTPSFTTEEERRKLTGEIEALLTPFGARCTAHCFKDISNGTTCVNVSQCENCGVIQATEPMKPFAWQNDEAE